MIVSILIIGPAGRLRDGLRAILATFPNIGEIITADNFELAHKLAAEQQPSLVIIDGHDYAEDDCLHMKKLLSLSGQSRCVVIANTMQQAIHARQIGADAVLLQGFSTSTLRQTLVSLNIIPESSAADGQAAFSQRKSVDVPLSQKS